MSSRPVGLVLPSNEPGGATVLTDLSAQAEQWGYQSLWFTDHVVGVRAMAGVYGSYWLDPLVAMTWVAARTSTIRLGTGVLVLPHRDAVLTAKMIASIDVFSGGRVDLGVGTGWSRTEFRALGMADRYEPRGAVTNECIEVLRACWAGGEVEYHGEFFDFRHVEFEPVPVQPRLPIWVGGDSGPALRRAARHADVWHPHDLAPDELRAKAEQIDERAGRSVTRSVRVALTGADLGRLTDIVDEYVSVGCESVVIDFRSQPAQDVARHAEKAASLLFG
ncbi:MAG TPA: TIGR03619 family F420-dependent LLM class oxidoreductase [Trebonia sp.]|jgi:probable F420-dependent oxidoreductase|nr:TIGR03619 family F420-dependent LLM class oxidoreductase [Trebonia sp.]